MLILGIPDETFWYSDVSFVRDIARDKAAYDQWFAYAMEKDAQQKRR